MIKDFGLKIRNITYAIREDKNVRIGRPARVIHNHINENGENELLFIASIAFVDEKIWNGIVDFIREKVIEDFESRSQESTSS